MTSFIQQFGYFAVVALVGLEALGVPLPGEATLISAALYAGATHHLSIVGVIVAAIAGATVGYSLSFLIGHWGGYRLVVRYGRYIGLDQTKVKLARYLFAHHGGKLVLFGRFVPILRAYGALLAGTSRMPWPPFLFYNLLGAVVWTVLYGGGAYLLGAGFERLSGRVALVLVAVAVIALVAGFLVIRGQEKRLEGVAEAAYPGPLEGYPGGPPL
jgi:membrane protein DedA with SNARE-associated domain